MSEIPIAPVKRLLKKSGAKKSSSTAVSELIEELEDYAMELGHNAVLFAEHNHRSTVKVEDMKLAIKLCH